MSTYLDWAASAPIRPAALDAMVDAAQRAFGNPTGAHRQAREARRVVDGAREVVADAVGAEPADVIFCGGGTESDNLAVFGSVAHRGGRPLCSAIEHHAVLHPVEKLGGVVAPVTPDGVIDLDVLEATLASTPDITLISVMLANNETGMIQPLDQVAAVMHEHAPDAVLHTDAVQGFVWLDCVKHCADASLISITGHKFGGPKGVGALVVRRGTGITPQIIGGGQEFELRSGTQNVEGIAGFAAAVSATVAELDDTNRRVSGLRDRLVDGLIEAIPNTIETGVRSGKIPGAAHVCFDGIESEALLFLLEREEIYASAASSCASGAQEPSHVLAAMGISRERAGASLRLSLGRDTTDAHIDHALAVIPAAVAQLADRKR